MLRILLDDPQIALFLVPNKNFPDWLNLCLEVVAFFNYCIIFVTIVWSIRFLVKKYYNLKIMFKILIRLAINTGMRDRNKLRFLKLLAKIEYGVAIFCLKLQQQAETEKLFNLASMLSEHGKQENKHGNMLASLARNNTNPRISLTDSPGCYINIVRPSGEVIVSRPDDDAITKPVTWDSLNFPGEQLTGLFENFDGISKRYFSTRFLFNNRAASDYCWEDKLAFMYVLEEVTASFYQELMKCDDLALSAIAFQIVRDEFNHANYLKLALANFAPIPQAAIEKWQHRLWWAKWGLIIDIINFFK